MSATVAGGVATVDVAAGGGGGAPTDATYIVQTPHAGLSAEQALSALGTGLVVNTTGTGVLSIYGGTSCINQFPRSLNASGVATCTDVAPADFASQTANTVLAAPDGIAGDPTFRALLDADVPNTITLDNLTQITARSIADTTGTLLVGRGGTGQTTAPDDNLLVGSGSAWELKTLPSCTIATQKLHYNIATNTWTCETDATGGGGGAPTDAVYIVGAANAGLSAERVVTDTATVTWDQATADQVKANVPADAVTNTILANMAANTVKVNNTGSAGDPVDMSVGASTVVGRGAAGNLVAAAVETSQIANDAVTYAKIQNVSATDRVLGRSTAAAGDVEEITFSDAAQDFAQDTFADDQVWIADSATAGTARAITNCTGASDALRYNTSTNAFSCGTISATGASLTRINGSSGAAGADLTWQRLSANCTANATTTLATCMTTTSVGAGTWSLKYKVIYQSAATSTGVDFAINHTGAASVVTASSWFVTSGATAANALADQVRDNTASLAEGKSARAVNTKMGSTLGVDTANANMLYVIEGVLVVTNSGSLELQHASELAASTQVMADTLLELHKVN